MLSSTLEMKEMIRVYTNLELEDNRLPQTGLPHSQGAEFKRMVQCVAA